MDTLNFFKVQVIIAVIGAPFSLKKSRSRIVIELSTCQTEARIGNILNQLCRDMGWANLFLRKKDFFRTYFCCVKQMAKLYKTVLSNFIKKKDIVTFVQNHKLNFSCKGQSFWELFAVKCNIKVCSYEEEYIPWLDKLNMILDNLIICLQNHLYSN